jgi:hypothetical protein
MECREVNDHHSSVISESGTKTFTGTIFNIQCSIIDAAKSVARSSGGRVDVVLAVRQSRFSNLVTESCLEHFTINENTLFLYSTECSDNGVIEFCEAGV